MTDSLADQLFAVPCQSCPLDAAVVERDGTGLVTIRCTACGFEVVTNESTYAELSKQACPAPPES